MKNIIENINTFIAKQRISNKALHKFFSYSIRQAPNTNDVIVDFKIDRSFTLDESQHNKLLSCCVNSLSQNTLIRTVMVQIHGEYHSTNALKDLMQDVWNLAKGFKSGGKPIKIKTRLAFEDEATHRLIRSYDQKRLYIGFNRVVTLMNYSYIREKLDAKTIECLNNKPNSSLLRSVILDGKECDAPWKTFISDMLEVSKQTADELLFKIVNKDNNTWYLTVKNGTMDLQAY